MTEPYQIPFNRPCLTGNEKIYMSEAIASGKISGDGCFTERCHCFLETYLGTKKALLTTSCTHALEMAALLLEVKPNDEVIIPSFTFVSTANAFVIRGARPIFADIRKDTLNMDEKGIEKLITSKTKAIVTVHYAGVGCEMDAIQEIARRFNVTIVEDNAHGLFGQYRGKKLGSFGALAAQSFHETKNVICGEGGALLINDPQFLHRAEILREKGTNRSRFFRGEVDRYTWVDIGSSYLPSDLLAAFLYAQLEASSRIQERRRQIWSYYYAGLKDWAGKHGISLPFVPDHCEQPFHLFYLIMPTLEDRQALIAHLKRSGIMAVFHYVPLHATAMGQSLGGRVGDCPVAETMSERLVRLPFYNDLDDECQNRVINQILNFYN